MNKYSSAPVAKITQSQLAPGVRWIVRGGERILQQLWSVRQFENQFCVGIYSEWRDVPVEEEC